MGDEPSAGDKPGRTTVLLFGFGEESDGWRVASYDLCAPVLPPSALSDWQGDKADTAFGSSYSN